MSTDAWGNKGTTIDDVVNDVSTNEFVLDSTFIAAVAFRKEATYPGCSLCRRRVQLRENGFTCASHGAREGAPTYRLMVRVLLGQVAHPGQEIWVMFWDEQMRSFVEFDEEFFRHLTTDEKTQWCASAHKSQKRGARTLHIIQYY